MTPKSLLRHKLVGIGHSRISRKGSSSASSNEVDDIQPPPRSTRVVLLLGQGLLRPARITPHRRAAQCGDRARRAALSVPERRVRRGTIRPYPNGARDRLVPGRAAEPGCVVPGPPSAATSSLTRKHRNCCTPGARPAAAPATGIAADALRRSRKPRRCRGDRSPPAPSSRCSRRVALRAAGEK